ncbi:MAG: hypothetical protein LBQ54_06935, partial [Planctomycetaceae bacterium]|nr:hypothetical protein [Planctomycetaceae bacterium]
MPPAGRDAAAGGNARALHPGLLPASLRRSLSYRKSFQHEAEGHPGCNVRTLPVPRTKPAPVSRWS